MKHYSTYQSQFIEMFGSETKKVLLEDVVFVKDDCRKPINEGVRSEMKEGELYPYYGATGVVDYINDYITDEELLCVAEDCGNYNAGEESAYIIRGKAWVNNHAHLVKMKEDCDIKYLYYYLKIANLMPYVSGTTRLKLTQKKLKEIPVVLPTTDNQKAFVAIAEQADKSKFTSLKSQFIEMFEGGKYPRLSLDEISKEWSKGQGFKKDDICEDGETHCIHYGELFTKYGPVINEVISRTSVEKKKMSKKGDILFPASDVTPNGLARCSMLPFDNIILGGDIIILRPKDDFNAAYLSYAINQQTAQLLTRVNGGVVKHMSAKGLKTVEIPVPPMDKQEEYIRIAEQADKSKYIN